jgi:hypothetical protein
LIVSVEAKSRHRKGVLGRPGTPDPPDKVRLRVGQLLNDAFAKATSHPHVVFLDLNLPPSEGEAFEQPWFRELCASIDRTCGGGECDPFNLIVFSNHPYHYGEDWVPHPRHTIVAVFSQKAAVPIADPLVLTAIHDAAERVNRPPSTFEEAG